MASELETLLAIESSGQLNPAQRSQLEQLKRENPNIGSFVGGIPMFSYNYEEEAKKAYGELGAYYDRILKDSQGDINKALSRLVEDYDRGKRIRKETLTETNTDLDYQAGLAQKAAIDSALSRGLYSKSAYDPSSGFGVADSLKSLAQRPIDESRESALLAFTRGEEVAGIDKARKEQDYQEQQKRYEFDLEQKRRQEAANLAETRGNRAYSRFQATQLI